MCHALRKLGVDITISEDEIIVIGNKPEISENTQLYLGNSGT